MRVPEGRQPTPLARQHRACGVACASKRRFAVRVVFGDALDRWCRAASIASAVETLRANSPEAPSVLAQRSFPGSLISAQRRRRRTLSSTLLPCGVWQYYNVGGRSRPRGRRDVSSPEDRHLSQVASTEPTQNTHPTPPKNDSVTHRHNYVQRRAAGSSEHYYLLGGRIYRTRSYNSSKLPKLTARWPSKANHACSAQSVALLPGVSFPTSLPN